MAAALGVSTGVAQPSSSSGSVGVQAESAADPGTAAVSNASAKHGDREVETLSQAEVRRIMLEGAEREGSRVAADLGLPPSEPLQQETDSNRRIYYIIGGALVAGGLVAGILALDDGGDGGGGPQNIPSPPGRPQ